MSFEQLLFVIVQYILLGLASEALAELIVDSKFSAKFFRDPWKKWTYPIDKPPPDTYFQRFKVFVDELWSCGYCTSVWTSGFLALFVSLDGPRALVNNVLVCWLISTLIIHRISNWTHAIFEIVRRGRVRTHDLLVRVSEQEDAGIGYGEGEGNEEVGAGDPKTG